MPVSAESPGIRRRRETARRIRQAVLQLAKERGFPNVTIELITATAGVSPRTFFNHFPTKEAAVLPPRVGLAPRRAERFIAAGPAHPYVVLADLTDALLEDLADGALEAETMEMWQIAHRNPVVLAAVLEFIDRFERSVADVVAQRLGRRPHDELPELIAELAMGAIQAGLERCARDAPTAGRLTVMRYLRRAVSVLHKLLALKSPMTPARKKILSSGRR